MNSREVSHVYDGVSHLVMNDEKNSEADVQPDFGPSPQQVIMSLYALEANHTTSRITGNASTCIWAKTGRLAMRY